MASHPFAHQCRHTFEHPRLWFHRYFLSLLCSPVLTSTLSFPSTNLLLLKPTVIFKKGRAAVGVFRREDLPTNGCSNAELRTEDLLVCETTRPSPERITTDLRVGQPYCGSSWRLRRWPSTTFKEAPCAKPLSWWLDFCMEKTFSWNWHCGTPQVFWSTHSTEVFALLKETVIIASAQEKSITTLCLTWKVHLLWIPNKHTCP